MRRREHAGRFFEDLAHDGLKQRLARLQVPGRVVELQAVRRLFLDQQVPSLAFNDRGDGDVGSPSTLGHGNSS
jgi:hypothetical protein